MPRRALNNDTGTPRWPGDHAQKHREAALKGWARHKGFTRDTVSRGRRKAAAETPAPTTGIALGRAARSERPHPSAEYGYSSHTLPVARLTLMHELGREQDKAKRTAIRRELRKLGVPSDQIPKEPRAPKPEPRQKRERSTVERKPADETTAERQVREYLLTHPQSENDRITQEYAQNVGRALATRKKPRQQRERSTVERKPRTSRAELEAELARVETRARELATTSRYNHAKQMELDDLIQRAARLQGEIDRRKPRQQREQREANQ